MPDRDPRVHDFNFCTVRVESSDGGSANMKIWILIGIILFSTSSFAYKPPSAKTLCLKNAEELDRVMSKSKCVWGGPEKAAPVPIPSVCDNGTRCFLCGASGGTFTCTLPDSGGANNKKMVIEDTASCVHPKSSCGDMTKECQANFIKKEKQKCNSL